MTKFDDVTKGLSKARQKDILNYINSTLEDHYKIYLTNAKDEDEKSRKREHEISILVNSLIFSSVLLFIGAFLIGKIPW